jgi:hypothetical protein
MNTSSFKHGSSLNFTMLTSKLPRFSEDIQNFKQQLLTVDIKSDSSSQSSQSISEGSDETIPRSHNFIKDHFGTDSARGERARGRPMNRIFSGSSNFSSGSKRPNSFGSANRLLQGKRYTIQKLQRPAY